MATYDYNEIEKELLEKGVLNALVNERILKEEKIYKFEDNDIAVAYSNFFQFCQVNLSEYSDELNIQPARFIYSEGFTVNACAGFINDYYIVAVQTGVMDILYQSFYSNSKIFLEEPKLADYKSLDQAASVGTRVPLEYLMFQVSTIFIYYHELSHLIQKSRFKESNTTKFLFNENYAELTGKEFKLINHILEYDSDLYGATLAWHHAVEYWQKLEKHSQTKENYFRVLSVALASLYAYFLHSYMRMNKKIYYNENSHPHPLIRINYVMGQFVSNSNKFMPDVDVKDILQQALLITEKLFIKVFQLDVVGSYNYVLKDEIHGIMAYIKYLMNNSKEIPYLATKMKIFKD